MCTPTQRKPTIADLFKTAREALCFWCEPVLARSLRVELSLRMTRSLARAFPAIGLIRVSQSVMDLPHDQVRLVMWHEAAHLVVAERHGTTVRPHGAQWAALLTGAGITASTRMSAALAESAMPSAARTKRDHYRHRCIGCHAIALARRPMTRRRCLPCLRAGLSGELVIERCNQ